VDLGKTFSLDFSVVPDYTKPELTGRIKKMIQVNANEAKARLSHLLSKVEKDPLRQHHKLMGVKIHEDPTTPLDDEDWPCDLK
jgi:hypothetical protein